MAYLKFTADHIFNGIQLLDQGVLIARENGRIEGIFNADEAGSGVQSLKGILCPGFINCHCHLELSHLKGVIPRGTGLAGFVSAVISQRQLNEEAILEWIEKAEEQMRLNGIVAVGDICNSLDTLSQKQKHRISYYNFIEVSGWDPDLAQSRFDKSKIQYNEFGKFASAGNGMAMAPHAAYSVSKELWDLISPYFRNRPTTIHNQETPAEDELFLEGKGDLLRLYEMLKIKNARFRASGKSSLQTYLHRLDPASRVILVHNTFTAEEDLKFCQKWGRSGAEGSISVGKSPSRLFFCLCVNANQYIEKALPPLELLRKYQCPLVLGTDSLASNDSLSILDEIKTILRFFPSIPLPEILQWATLKGAEALGFDQELGSFEAGKYPGIVLISESREGMLTENSSARRIA
jgi:aminodeoxyfutalosine deaminase